MDKPQIHHAGGETTDPETACCIISSTGNVQNRLNIETMISGCLRAGVGAGGSDD